MKKSILVLLFLVLFATQSFSSSITGTVTGYIVENVTITLSDNSTATTATAADGTYSFVDLDNGTYTVTPTLTDATFVPTATEVAIKTSDNGTGTDFVITVVTINIEPDAECEVVSADGNMLKCRYTITDSVSADNSTQEFRLTIPLITGSLLGTSVYSLSDELSYWIAESTGQLSSSTQVLVFDNEIDTTEGFSPSAIKRPFTNKDSPSLYPCLYLVLDNKSGINTGTSYWVLILGRN